MAGKRPLYTIIILAAIVTIAALQYGQYTDRVTHREKLDDQKFIKTYMELSSARGFIDTPDSLESILESVFTENDTDSLWMREYLSGIGDDIEKRQLIWQAILDSLNTSKEKFRR
ncbi:MAG: hypothetical protein V3W18_02440 [candidate division Zixibacteria bacterium]